jgi:uncharacterized protein YydD (DUF2326 family)
MQLIKVYANKNTFRPVEFNPAGLSFIVARQKNPGASEDGKTYNGVGKSLLVRIVNFCLGAKADGYKSFCEKLPDWEFFIDFRINVHRFTARRSTNDPKKIFLNNEECTINKFTEKLQKLCFVIPEEVSYLSFRSLLPFFLRPTLESYADCMKPVKTGNEYQALVYNAFLLGLDVNLAQRKFKLRKEQERIRDLEKAFRDDSLLHDFFMGNRDISLTLDDLNDNIAQMENNLSKFKVADDYYDVQKEADIIEKELFDINNDIIIIQNNIENIETSISINSSPTMSVFELEKIYNEAKILFPENIKKTLNDISAFYTDLIANRKRRLLEQKNKLDIELENKLKESYRLRKRLNDSMKYLGEHQALDLFLSLGQKCESLKQEKDNLLKYQNMQTEYKAKDLQTKKEFLGLLEDINSYLLEIEETTKGSKEYFRQLAKRFYPQSSVGLTIRANEGENQLAFSIEPKIESDASDGINKVKLFCYDLALLFEGKNHTINFIFHDSRLYDSIDERQKAELFRILFENFRHAEKQYIASVNQNQLNEIRSILSADEYKSIIDDNTVLTLTDDSDAEKLLGIKVDIGNK